MKFNPFPYATTGHSIACFMRLSLSIIKL